MVHLGGLPRLSPDHRRWANQEGEMKFHSGTFLPAYNPDNPPKEAKVIPCLLTESGFLAVHRVFGIDAVMMPEVFVVSHVPTGMRVVKPFELFTSIQARQLAATLDGPEWDFTFTKPLTEVTSMDIPKAATRKFKKVWGEFSRLEGSGRKKGARTP